MPEDEFERYLTLLSKTLRLSDTQRDAIAAELRDHMEARLCELTLQGVDREQAIETALAEFGDASDLARTLAATQPQHKRKPIMQTLIATAAAAGIAASAVIFTGAPPDPQQTQFVGEQQEAGLADVRPANDTQSVRTDGFALEQDLLFYARSETSVEFPDAEPLPALTAYGLKFSQEVPQSIFSRQKNRLVENDPYYVEPPEGVSVDELRQRSANRAEADLDIADRNVYAELSTIAAPIAEGRFRVRVELVDAEERVIGQADAIVSGAMGWLGDFKPNHHTLQKHLLIFSEGLDVSRVAGARVSVEEVGVKLREIAADQQLALAAEQDEIEAAENKPRQPPLETEWSTQQIEIEVLSEAIDGLNESMDLHRRFFERALVDPGAATQKERDLAHRKMHSIQTLRSNLNGQYTSYLLRC